MNTPIRILIVEDSEDDTLFMLRELQRGGCSPTYERVETPETMNAALDKQQWDIIISDFSMPCFSMTAALTMVKEKGLDIPFIIVSGAIGEEAAVEAMRAGVHDYVMKGDLARLVPIVEREVREAKIRCEHREAEAKIEHHNKSIETLYTVAQTVSQTLDLDELLDAGLKQAVEATGADIGMIYLMNPEETSALLKAYKGIPEEVANLVLTVEIKDEELHNALRRKNLNIDPSAHKGKHSIKLAEYVAKIGKLTSISSVPISTKGNLQGFIITGSYDSLKFSADDIELLAAIGNELGVGIENATLIQRTRELSVTDELTGLYNRRHFYEVLETEIYRAKRYGRPFCLAVLDLDKFKEYNDKYGHTVGDGVLKVFASMLVSALRKTDMAFRYGGDEFTIVLPGTDARRAMQIVERVRSKWFSVPKPQYLTGFSAGIAYVPNDAETADGLVFLADTALYHSKRIGGNKCTLVSELGTISSHVLDKATLDQVYALAATVDARDPLTYGHSKRVATMSEMLGKAIGMSKDDLVNLHAAALLHDIGKVGVPDSILTKPGQPTEHEWKIIRQHSSEGAKIVGHVKELASLVPLVRHHHEWYDGSGYPDRLKGEDIPLGARVISIADAYDTMTTLRPYRINIPRDEAADELVKCSGSQFDPELVGAFCYEDASEEIKRCSGTQFDPSLVQIFENVIERATS